MSKKPTAVFVDSISNDAYEFKLGERFDLLPKLIKDFHLTPYQEACYKDTPVDTMLTAYPYERRTSMLMNTYEGILYSHLTHARTRVVLLAAMFSRFQTPPHRDDDNYMPATGGFSIIHRELKGRKTAIKSLLTDQEVLDVLGLIRQSFKTKTWNTGLQIEHAILSDAKQMWRYHSVQSVRKRILQAVDMTHPYEISDATRYVAHSSASMLYPWSTRWAKLKKNVLNFPAMDRHNAEIAKVGFEEAFDLV